jgi:hypothetical protein
MRAPAKVSVSFQAPIFAMRVLQSGRFTPNGLAKVVRIALQNTAFVAGMIIAAEAGVAGATNNKSHHAGHDDGGRAPMRRKPMTENKQTDIPQEMRELAVKNIDQARAAYSQLMDAAQKAQEMMKALIPSNPAVQGLNEAQERAMRITQQNLDANFALANELTKAKDLTEALQIQSRHAQLQMHAYALQAQELTGMVSEAAKKGKL